MQVYITNDSTSEIQIDDLRGLILDVGETLNLSDHFAYTIYTASENLKNYVLAEMIIVNDGIKDLTPEEGFEHLTIETVYEARHPLEEHTNIVPPPTDKHTILRRNKDTLSYEWVKHPQDFQDNEDIPEFPTQEIPEYGLLGSDGTSYVWLNYYHGGGLTTQSGISFTMSDHQSRDYVANGDRTWVSIRSFVFDGTNLWTPKKFAVISSRAGKSTTGYARLFDYTNGLEIAQIAWTAEDKQIYINSNLQNLPTGEAIIEFQTKTAKNGRDIRTHYMALY